MEPAIGCFVKTAEKFVKMVNVKCVCSLWYLIQLELNVLTAKMKILDRLEIMKVSLNVNFLFL